MDNTFPTVVSQVFFKGILEGFWWVLKLTWPFLIFIILLKIFERWVNRKIDDWKRRKRLKK